jgi:hypothetical protein
VPLRLGQRIGISVCRNAYTSLLASATSGGFAGRGALERGPEPGELGGATDQDRTGDRLGHVADHARWPALPFALADETSPAFVQGAFQLAAETPFNHVYEARP